MKALKKDQIRAWCGERSVNVTSNDRLSFDSQDRPCISVDLPEKPYQILYLANLLLPYREATPFSGALLWIREWGIWSEHAERVGYRVMEIMRCIGGERASMSEAPGYLFNAEELIDLQVCFVQPLLIGWDAFLIPESGDYMVATSHDEATCVLARTTQTHERLLADLKTWNPREDRPWY